MIHGSGFHNRRTKRGTSEAVPVSLSTTDIPAGKWVSGTVATYTPTTAVLVDDASGQFSASGGMLRLEKPLGAAATTYNIQFAGNSPVTLTVQDQYPVAATERFNARTLAKLFQDSAKTTPVAANNDPIGSITGLAAGWEFNQATSANRPLYKTNVQGGQPGIYFDGSNDCFAAVSAAAIAWANGGLGSSTFRKTIFVVHIPDGFTTTRTMLSWATGATHIMTIRNDTSGRNASLVGTGGSTTSATSTSSHTTLQPVIDVFSVLGFDGGATYRAQSLLYTNGVIDISSGTGTNPVPTRYTTANATGAYTCDGCRIGSAGTTTPGSYYKGHLLDIVMADTFATRADVEQMCRLLAAEYGFQATIDTAIGTPTYIDPWDASQFETVLDDDFTADTVNPSYATDTAPSGWIPSFVSPSRAAKSQYGSGGASGAERGYHADKRDATVVSYGADAYTQADSVLDISPKVMPAGFLTATGISESPASGFTTHARVTHGWKDITYGYFGVRVKMPSPANDGDWPAWWMIDSDFAWHSEIDGHEGFGQNGNLKYATNFHLVATDANVNDAPTNGFGLLSEFLPGDYHEIGFHWKPDGIDFYMDRRKTHSMPAIAPLDSFTYSAGGSDGTNGTKTLYGATSTSLADALIRVVISGGAVTSATIIGPGCVHSGAFTWYEDSAHTKTLGTTAGFVPTGFAITGTTVPSTSGKLHPWLHQPHYALLNYAVGSASSGGVMDSAINWPRHMKVDRVIIAGRKVPTPAAITPGVDGALDAAVTSAANAVIAQMTAVGATPSAGHQTEIALLIRWMMATEECHSSLATAWAAPAATSLWDRRGGIYVLHAHTSGASLINWKTPGTNDLVKVGSPTFTAFSGWSFPGTTTDYLRAASLDPATAGLTNQDFGLTVGVTSAPSNSSLAAMVAFDTTSMLQGSDSAFEMYAGHNVAPGYAYLSKSRVLTPGLYHLRRGFKSAVFLFKDDAMLWGGSYTGNATSTVGGSFKVGWSGTGNGAAFSSNYADCGPALMQAENKVLSERLAAFVAAVTV